MPELGPTKGSEPKKRGPRQRSYPAAKSEPRLLDQAGAAFYLGISIRSIANLEAAGRLQVVRLLAHTKLYDRLALDKLVDDQQANQ